MLNEKTIAARIKGETARTLGNIAARTELPTKMFWLSFADDNGFRGAVIVHANDFLEAVMEANLHSINPHGECQGVEIPVGHVIPDKWKYRLLDRAECERFDAEMMAGA